MRSESVEIYSDATNAAVMRHPGRRFPGVLIQGDTLHTMLHRADEALNAGDRYELEDLRDHLRDLVDHYKKVLVEHDLELPFFEPPAAQGS
jgi:predicted RNase H-like HicB family nuclease